MNILVIVAKYCILKHFANDKKSQIFKSNHLFQDGNGIGNNANPIISAYLFTRSS